MADRPKGKWKVSRPAEPGAYYARVKRRAEGAAGTIFVCSRDRSKGGGRKVRRPRERPVAAAQSSSNTRRASCRPRPGGRSPRASCRRRSWRGWSPHAEPVHQHLGAVVAGADRDAVAVEDLGDVMGVDALELEGDRADPVRRPGGGPKTRSPGTSARRSSA